MSTEKRRVYFVMQTEVANDGQFIPCIAVEGESGYHRTDWKWGTDYKEAQEICKRMNEQIGITAKEAAIIQIGTMKL